MDDFLFGDLVPQGTSSQPPELSGRFLNSGRSKNTPGRSTTSKSKKGHLIPKRRLGSSSIQHRSSATKVEHQETLSAQDVHQLFPNEQDQPRVWNTRQTVEAEHWDDVRSAVFQDVVASEAVPVPGSVCTACGNHASVLCDNCPVVALCLECDVQYHTYQPFHRRRHWTRGFLEPLSPNTSVSATGEYVEFAPVLPLHAVKKECQVCKIDCEIRASAAMVITITLQGRFHLHVPVWSCPTCSNDVEVERIDLIRHGFFKASPVRLSTLVHEEVFIVWQKLRSHSPGTSLTAFIACLQEVGKRYGCDGPVDLERLEKAFTEWTYVQFELQGLQGSDYMTCEACGAEARCVHLDGNFKLYRYRSSGSNEQASAYHLGTFLEDKDAVNAHVAKMQGVTKASNRCGISSWTAGRNDPGPVPSKRSQDETGLVAATCRHSVILGGVNMYRGELYAYSHFLHQVRFPHVQYYASDIVCKYWPWTQRVSRTWPEYSTGDSKPFLSVMHATGHAYYCQITFGGFWQEGSGWSVMETTEIANAFLSRAGSTTKYMTAMQRNDTLTDMVLNYNKQKHQRMPRLLVSRLEGAKMRIPELHSQLNALLDDQKVPLAQVDVLVAELRSLAAALSKRDGLSNGQNLENAIEMVTDSIRVRLEAVSNMASTSKERKRFRRLVAADKAKLSKLLKRYERESGEEVKLISAMEGVFPWHAHSAGTGGLSLSEKRAICDTYMRLQRSLEEVDIVREEMRNLLTHCRNVIDQLVHTHKLVKAQLDRDEADRTPVMNQTSANQRYCIQHEHHATLRGLHAIVSQAIAQRQLYLDDARSLLEEHLSD